MARSLQGYNATVLAYGQTGSGKTLTMSGGTGIHGIPESGEKCSTAAHRMRKGLQVSSSCIRAVGLLQAACASLGEPSAIISHMPPHRCSSPISAWVRQQLMLASNSIKSAAVSNAAADCGAMLGCAVLFLPLELWL